MNFYLMILFITKDKVCSVGLIRKGVIAAFSHFLGFTAAIAYKCEP